MGKTFFTADQHFGHEAILHSCKRPFKTSKEMDRQIIKRYNEVVTDDDTVYFLGDVSMYKGPHIVDCIKKLKGRKILILGNHDKSNPFDYIEWGFESAHTSLVNTWVATTNIIYSLRVLLAHDPALSAFMKQAECKLMVCGHVHNLFKYVKTDDGLVINVGVDVHDFKPVSLEGIGKIVEEQLYG